MPRSYLDITSSTSATHSYSGLTLLVQPSLGTSVIRGVADHDTDEDQLRIFKNADELVRPGVTGAEYSVNETTKNVVLNDALISADRLLIVRQTRRNQPYVTFKNSARLKQSDDVDLFVDQVMFIVQELNEEAEIQNILDDGTYYDLAVRTGFNVTVTGSESAGPFSYAAISLIRDDRVEHADQFIVVKNDTTLTIADDYTVDAANEEITLTSVLVVDDDLEIRRQTSLDRYTPSLPDGSSFSSDIFDVQFDQLKNLIQELPYEVGLEGTSIRTYRNPRRKTFITYSGPGDRFYYGNLPYFRDGTVFVWKDDVLLTDETDYLNDDWQDIIDLLTSLLAGETIIISTAPGCPFPLLFCNGSGDFGEQDPDRPQGPDPIETDPVGVEQEPIATGDATLLGRPPNSADDNFSTGISAQVWKENLTSSNDRRTAIFQWDISNIDPSIYSTITMILTNNTGTNTSQPLSIRRITRAVVMDEVTWNSFASGGSWETPGARGSSDYDVDSAVVFTIPDAQTLVRTETPDLKALVVAAKALGNTLTLTVAMPGEGLSAKNNFYTIDNPDIIAHVRPILRLTL